MKKLLYILFISAYLISNVGVSIVNHFCCCGSESDLAVFYTEHAGEGANCFDDECRMQECSTEVVSLKIKDLHLSVPNDGAAQPSEIVTVISPEDILKTTCLLSSSDNKGVSYSDPPVYLSNCTFRI